MYHIIFDVPHIHHSLDLSFACPGRQSAWEIVHSLVVGYVEDDDEEETVWEHENKARHSITFDGTRLRVAGKEVLLMAPRGALGGDNLVRKSLEWNGNFFFIHSSWTDKLRSDQTS